MSQRTARRCRERTARAAARNAKGRQRPERAHGGRERSAQRPSERNRGGDPQRLAAYTVLRAVADGAYANLELPKVLRDRGIQGRDAAFTTELVYGAVADARPLRPDHRRGRRPARDQDRPQRPRHPAARRAPAARDAGAHARRRRRDRGPGAQGQRRRRGRVRQRRHAPGQRARPRCLAGRGRPVGRARPRSWPSSSPTPSGSSRRCGPPCSVTAPRPRRPSTPSSPPS